LLQTDFANVRFPVPEIVRRCAERRNLHGQRTPILCAISSRDRMWNCHRSRAEEVPTHVASLQIALEGTQFNSSAWSIKRHQTTAVGKESFSSGTEIREQNQMK
jgi:hypothetical protein